MGGMVGGLTNSIFPGLGSVFKGAGNAVGSLMPKPPAAPGAPPVAPTIDNSQPFINAATAEQLKRANAGRASTILTGGQGVTSNAKTSSATLLGQV